MNKVEVNYYRLLSSFSLAMDFYLSGVMYHHQRVAYIALCIGESLGLTDENLSHLFTAAILHDVGTSTWKEKATLRELDTKELDHCKKGYELLKNSKLFSAVADIILHHHDKWNGDNKNSFDHQNIPLASRIIYLADRIEILISNDRYILHQVEDITKIINANSGILFDPELVKIFNELAQVESFWLNITSGFLTEILFEHCRTKDKILVIEGICDVSELMAKLIDDKSPFTHRHSRGVAQVASEIGKIYGFDKTKCELIYTAGLLHDLGKLSVPEFILDKPSKLTKEEFEIIRKHTYYTYHIIKRIGGLDDIAEWAAYHHEKLDGTGYPFRIKNEGLSSCSRIVAVSDIFTALTEIRPYRDGLPESGVKKILLENVRKNAIDGEFVNLVIDNYSKLSSIVQSESAL